MSQNTNFEIESLNLDVDCSVSEISLNADLLVGIQGPKGDKGETGPLGPQGILGPKGDPFTYSDFTPSQLESLRGPIGNTEYLIVDGIAETPDIEKNEHVKFLRDGNKIYVPLMVDGVYEYHELYKKEDIDDRLKDYIRNTSTKGISILTDNASIKLNESEGIELYLEDAKKILLTNYIGNTFYASKNWLNIELDDKFRVRGYNKGHNETIPYINLDRYGTDNSINAGSDLIISANGSGSISFDLSDAGLRYIEATWVERLKDLILSTEKGIDINAKGAAAYFYAGTDDKPLKMEIGSKGKSYIQFNKDGTSRYYGLPIFKNDATFEKGVNFKKGITLGDVYPLDDKVLFHNKAVFDKAVFDKEINVPAYGGVRFVEEEEEFGHIDFSLNRSLEIFSKENANINAKQLNVNSFEISLMINDIYKIQDNMDEGWDIYGKYNKVKGLFSVGDIDSGYQTFIVDPDVKSVYIDNEALLNIGLDPHDATMSHKNLKIKTINTDTINPFTTSNLNISVDNGNVIKLRESENLSLVLEGNNNRLNFVAPEIRWVEKLLQEDGTYIDKEHLLSEELNNVPNEINKSILFKNGAEFYGSTHITGTDLLIDTPSNFVYDVTIDEGANLKLDEGSKLILNDIEDVEEEIKSKVNATYNVITEDDVEVTTDDTKGVAPYSTSYGYTNITITNPNIKPIEGAWYSFVVKEKLVVSGTYRNVRVRFGEDDVWHPVMGYSTSILPGQGYFLLNMTAALFQYKTSMRSEGAFHKYHDADTTYTYLVNTVSYSNIKIDANGYGARYSLLFNTNPISDVNDTYSSIVTSSSTAANKTAVTVNKLYIDRLPIYDSVQNVAAGATGTSSGFYQKYNQMDLRYTCNTTSNYVSLGKRVYLYLKDFNPIDYSFKPDATVGNIVSSDKLSTRFQSGEDVYLYFLGWSNPSSWYQLSPNFSQRAEIFKYSPTDGTLTSFEDSTLKMTAILTDGTTKSYTIFGKED